MHTLLFFGGGGVQYGPAEPNLWVGGWAVSLAFETLTAKQDYHLLVTNLLSEHTKTQHHTNAYTALCVERQQWYEQAKHYTMQQCANAKTIFLTHERFAHLCAGTRLFLTNHS